jgi:peptidoglycan/xylan/chitin deacetylase (PgdA/CDA1 family)
MPVRGGGRILCPVTTVPAGTSAAALAGTSLCVAGLEGTSMSGETWRGAGRWLAAHGRRARHRRFPAPRPAALRRTVVTLAFAALVALAAAPFAAIVGGTPRALAAEPAVMPPGPTVIWHGPRGDRVVALTFDDGWSPANLRRIYRILVRERVPATFFVTGIYVQRAPTLWRAIAAAGYPLANHSYLHRDTRNLTPRLAALDMTLTRDVVERATGRAILPYYRPPYGERNPATDRESAAAGFPYVVLWDTTGADTTRHATVAEVVRGASAGRAGSIVLLHAGPAVTPRALPKIIARYRARGFRFVTVPELLATPPTPVAPGESAPPGGGPSPAAGAAPASRSIDRPGAEEAEADAHVPAVVAAPAPARAGSPAPSSPPARDAAWVRRDGTPASVAVFTIVIQAIVLVCAAAVGHARPGDGEPGA